MVDQRDVRWQNRAHFLGCAAQVMRHVLVDHARARRAEKRGGGGARVTLDEEVAATAERDVDLLALDEALRTLAALDERQSRVVELRYFGGLSYGEIAQCLEVSLATVKRDWVAARAWLYGQLYGSST
jgi:RNA polymerase sigma factor (TIGR02999 family)